MPGHGRRRSQRAHTTTETPNGIWAARGACIVEDAITIYRPVSEVYTYWRNLENLPHFMEHLEEVRVIDRFHSHWVARGPLGVHVEWDAEIINDIPPTLLVVEVGRAVRRRQCRLRPVQAGRRTVRRRCT